MFAFYLSINQSNLMNISEPHLQMDNDQTIYENRTLAHDLSRNQAPYLQ